jgi:pimeloyl-ACP methyl ester carboxylesterase
MPTTERPAKERLPFHERGDRTLQRLDVLVRGRTVRVARAGSGAAVLLVHGGWGGADMHWGQAWQRLTARHDVIAPDLPGLGAVDAPPLASVSDYAKWLAELLDALAVERVVCIGNSFGASVAWSFAGRYPERCSKLVLVDGFPMPRTPLVLAWVGRAKRARRLACTIVSRWIYNESNIRRAFAEVSKVPAELRHTIDTEWPVIVPHYVDILVAGDGAPTPSVAPLLIWGARDRLPGSNPRDAARWHERLAGSTLHMIENAGHFPQIEAPDAFVDAVEDFIRT